jgi:Xaa-Pro dipeptidase
MSNQKPPVEPSGNGSGRGFHPSERRPFLFFRDYPIFRPLYSSARRAGPHGPKGNTPAMAQGASFRRIGKNEPIGIDYGVGINGYLADQFRTFVIGDLPGELMRAHDCSVEVHYLFVKEAKPGVSCSDLYRLALKKAEKTGLGEHFMGYGEGKVRFVGHGLGLEIDEYPILAPRFNQRLEPGMVIALEPKFVFPGKGVVGLEDDYLVTATGIERLTLTDQTVIKL